MPAWMLYMIVLHVLYHLPLLNLCEATLEAAPQPVHPALHLLIRALIQIIIQFL